MKQWLFALLLVGVSATLFAQSTHSFTYQTQDASGRQLQTSVVPEPPHRTCATMPMDSARRAATPNSGTLQQFEQWLQIKIAQEANSTNDIYTLPVIVHVIHNGENVGAGRNISAAQVQSQIDVLNEDFRRRNPDTTNTPLVYQPVAADSRIEFCLAQIDEQDNALAEPGINRVDRNTAGFAAPPYTTSYIDNVIKPATIWDPEKYFNVWVLDIGGGILGYAQFPTQSGLPGIPSTNNANTDGIVVGYRFFGRGSFPQLSSTYNLGRTATHEVGHWLGLRHIWGDGGCSVDDFCNDTPLSDAPNYGCQTTTSSCGSADMVENYMDYSNDACFNLFTEDQKARMRTVMENSPRRKELRNSVVCNPNVAPVADFTAQPKTIYAGGVVRFEDLSSGNPTQWNWQFSGGAPNTSTAQNPQVRYYTPGLYTVVLQAINANGNDVETKTAYIEVLPPVGCDTLNFPPPGQLTYYTIGGEALVGWNSQLQDQAKAQLFDNYQPFNYITGGIFLFATAHKTANSNATVTFGVWDSTGAGGEPGQLLDSVVVDLSVVELFVDNNLLLQVGFDPIPITGNFYLGFKMNGFVQGDTLGLVSNTSGDSPPGYGWEQWSDGSWHPFDSVYSSNGIPLEISIFASPLVTQSLPFATFSASDTSVCLGETVTYVADSQQAGNSYSWVFPGANPYVAFGDTVTVSYDTAGTHPVYMVVDGSCASSDDTLAMGFMEVNSIPSIDSFITVPASCGQTNGQATAVVNGGVLPYQYEWDANANYQTTPTADSLAPGTYYLFIEDSKGCEDVGIANVGTTGGPVGAIDTVQDVSCYDGTDGQATVSATQGTPPYTFEWQGGLTGPTQTSLAAGSYIVTITDDRDCENFLTVDVSQPDSIAPKVAADDVSCQGNDGSATVSASGGTGNYTFTWSNGQQGSTITGLTPATYTVTVTDANNCTKTAQVTVGTLPAVTISNTSSQNATCASNNGTASATATGGDGNFSFAWSNGQQGSTITGLATGTYQVTVTDGNNCSAVDSVFVDFTDNLVGTLSPDQDICEGESATLTASGGVTYTWTPAPTIGQGNPSITVNPNNTTTYTCIIAEGPCADTLDVTVTVKPVPVTTIDQGDSIVVCRNDPYTLTASGAATYSWSTGDQGNSVTRNAVQTEDIMVTGTTDGCSSMDTIHVEVEDCTGIEEPAWADNWQLYPNPAQDQVVLAWPTQMTGTVQVRIFTSTGQLMYQAEELRGTETLSVQNWAAGLYQVEIRYQGERLTRQLAIIR